MDPQNAPTPDPARPSLELWLALVASALPHAVALGAGGYGRVALIVPLAAALTIIDAAAGAVAWLQRREDARAERRSHWLVWATLILAGIWIAYALYVLLLTILVQLFCINQLCRGPFGI